MVQKFDFQPLDLQGAYRIKPFYATDNRGGLLRITMLTPSARMALTTI